MDCLCRLSHGSNSFIQRPNARKPEKTNLIHASKRTHKQTRHPTNTPPSSSFHLLLPLLPLTVPRVLLVAPIPYQHSQRHSQSNIQKHRQVYHKSLALASSLYAATIIPLQSFHTPPKMPLFPQSFRLLPRVGVQIDFVIRIL